MLAQDGETERPRRRSQEERRRDATMSILQATIDLLTDRGYVNLTIADVASQAGISRGALNHYFRTKQDLVVASTRYAMDRSMQRIDRLSVEASSREAAVEAFLLDAEGFFFSREYIALTELLYVGRHDRKVAEVYFPVVEEYRTTFDAAWHRTLVKLGMAPAEATNLINLTNYLMRGMALSSLWVQDKRPREQFLQVWRERVGDLFPSDR